jgi:hypothetical protein
MTGTSTSERLASALAVLAVLAVTGTAVATAVAYAGRNGDSRPAAAAKAPRAGTRAFDHGRLVGSRDGSAVFEVPARAQGWTRQPRDSVLYYVDRRGRPAVGVEGAAVFRDGYCPQQPDGSNRGFVGFTRPAPGPGVRAANRALGEAWVEAVSLDEHRRSAGPHTPIRTRRVALADGTRALRSTSRITVTDHGPCDAPAVELTMLSFETGGAVTHLVMVRDVGARGTLPDEVADQVLATVRRVRD